jgi:hypothetical protein
MRKMMIICNVVLALSCACGAANAQIPGVGLVTGLLKKVIVAMDLKVQQMQNKVIALQNTQKQLENQLSLGKLRDISDWLGQEKELYRSYYEELSRVKALLSDYAVVRRTIRQQIQLVGEYKRAWSLFSNDRHFNAAELQYMANIYNGILGESIRDLDELMLAVTAARTRMNDGERLKLISQASGALQTNLDHLRQFNGQNAALSYSRANGDRDKAQVRELYGIH